MSFVGCPAISYFSTLYNKWHNFRGEKKVNENQWRTQEFCSGGLKISVEDRGQRERGSGGGSPLVRGSGGSCNLVQEISFHIVTVS
jgi:hypothetical protein